MANSLENTQNVSETRNPQGQATFEGASESSDFQETAPDSVLRQRGEGDLNVEQTGEAADRIGPITVSSDNAPYYWAVGTLLVIFVAAIVLIRMIRKEEQIVRVTRPSAAKASASKKSTKKPAKKSSKKGSKRKK